MKREIGALRRETAIKFGPPCSARSRARDIAKGSGNPASRITCKIQQVEDVDAKTRRVIRSPIGSRPWPFLLDGGIEVVSHGGRANSLLTGKRTGNFAESGLLMRFLSLIHEQIQLFSSKIPYARNREFLRA